MHAPIPAGDPRSGLRGLFGWLEQFDEVAGGVLDDNGEAGQPNRYGSAVTVTSSKRVTEPNTRSPMRPVASAVSVACATRAPFT